MPDNSPGNRWVLLIHQIPPKPDYFRVKVGRRLQRLGAVPIKNSVYVLPRSAETVEDFQWQLREIVAGGGEATICEAAFLDGLSDSEIENLFRVARDADYQAIVTEVKQLLKTRATRRKERSPLIDTELARLKRRLADIVKIDFFGARSRQTTEEAVGRLEARVRFPEHKLAAPQPAGDLAPGRGRTWVTRKGIFVDRIASAWLIRRFIDPDARFKFVEAEGYQAEPGELRFDMYQAEYTHEGDHCTFETLVTRFGISDQALRGIAEIVHDIDCKDQKFGRSETSGVERLLAGIAKQAQDDTKRLELGTALFDALYASIPQQESRSSKARGERRPATRRKGKR